MEIDILDFIEQCRDLAKQALGKHAGEPASGGVARWVHVVLHCFRVEDGHSYRETPIGCSTWLRFVTLST